VKHAPRHLVTVRIIYTPRALLIDVSAAGIDGAVAAGPITPGSGLMGLRERARAAGGRLEAGPTANGGFQVTADLPTGEAAA
jgi:signal transduction histidine kinase